MSDRGFRLDNMISALVGGVAGGLLVWWLVPPSQSIPTPDTTTETPAGATTTASESPAAAPIEDAQKRLARLEATMGNVQKRVSEQAAVDVVEEDDAGDGAGKRITVRANDPKFQSAVRAVLDKAKWEEEQLEIDKRDERRDQRISRQVDELAKELDLNDDQADQVEIVLQARADTFRALRDGDERPVTRQEWQQKFTEIQADTRKKLEGFLDATQLEAYDKFQQEQGFGPWGGRPRPSR